MTDKASLAAQRTLVVSADYAGTRLDKWLSDAIDGLTRTRAKALIDAGAVSRNEAVFTDNSWKVREGETYTLTLPPLEAPVPMGEAILLDVVYEDDALIVVNNDDLLCQIADPPLSSVLSPMDRVGYEAARMLNRMLAGTPAPAKPLLLEPAGVVTRRSSDVIAVDDPVAATALSFIRRRACDGIKVEDVLDHLHISRSLLEQKLRKAIGRTPLAEIRRVRVERAKQLLAETDLHMTAIARASGFASDVRLSSVFRQLTGTTPTAYRAESAVAMRSPRTGPIDQP